MTCASEQLLMRSINDGKLFTGFTTTPILLSSRSILVHLIEMNVIFVVDQV